MAAGRVTREAAAVLRHERNRQHQLACCDGLVEPEVGPAAGLLCRRAVPAVCGGALHSKHAQCRTADNRTTRGDTCAQPLHPPVQARASAMQHTAAAALGAPLSAVAARHRAAVSAPCRAAPRRRAALRVRAAADGDAGDAPSAPLQLRRRDALSLAAASAAAALSPSAPALAAGRGKAKSLPDDAYSALPVRNPGGGCAAGVARNGSAPRQP